ncbi:MAG: carboxypeptidase-like regulatory domain-containing protein [bacterium]|nr:carboxypeptidase-like regulatory domain-containing protein [bacterium]
MNWGSDRKNGIMVSRICTEAVFFLVLLFVSRVFAGGVDGRLVTGTGSVENGVVQAYRSVDFSQKPVAVSSPTGPDGKYSLEVGPGTWYLASEAGQLWSYCGQNPVTVSEDDRPWIGFILERWPAPVYTEAEGNSYDGALSGTVLIDGAPGDKVNVTLYFDDSDGFRGMGFLRAPPTGPDGRFRLDMVPEGRYYLIARKRGSGQGVGPMLKGDLIAYYRHNPVQVTAGKVVEVALPLTPKRQDRDINAAPGLSGQPGFGGTVTDGKGRPVSGVHVFAYLEPEMGHHKPAGLSSLTDIQGRYTITLPGPGKYYVGARDGYGDNPAPGELFGHYQGTPDHSLLLKAGQNLESVDIVVEGVLVP